MSEEKAKHDYVFLQDYTLRYLTEEPVIVSIEQGQIDKGDVAFSHEKIAEALADIVCSVPTPYCIGLSGAWGSGKTGIAESMAKIITEGKLRDTRLEGKILKTHYFDVLEHSEDVFRRQLLISMDKELTGGKFHFDKCLYQNVTYEEKNAFQHHRPSIKDGPGDWWKYIKERSASFTWCRALLILIIAGVFVWFAYRNLPPSAQPLSIAAVIIAALLGLSPQLFKSVTQLRNDDAPKSPEQLIKHFGDLLNHIGLSEEKVTKNYNDKLVLIIDNLDRCDPQNVTEVLTALTTFIKRPGVVAVVPCDVEKIIDCMALSDTENNVSQRQDSANNKYQRERASEFLRKTFNTVVHMPKLAKLDVRKFASSCIERSTFATILELDPTYKDRLIQIITMGFYDQPRRIKTLINNMTSRLAIWESLEGFRTISTYNNEGDLICAIAWIQVLRERWPRFWRYLLDHPDKLWALLNIKIDEDLDQALPLASKLLDGDEKSSLKAFIENTNWVTIGQIMPVLYLRTESEKPLAGEIIFSTFLNTDDPSIFNNVSHEEFQTYYDYYLKLAKHHFETCLFSGGVEAILTAIRALVKTIEKTPESKIQDLASLVTQQFKNINLPEKISEIKDPQIVILLSSNIDSENQDIAHALLGKLATHNLEALERNDPWLIEFVFKADVIGDEARMVIKTEINNAIEKFRNDEMDEEAELAQIESIKNILEFFIERDAMVLLVGADTPTLHAEFLIPDGTNKMKEHIELQLILSKVLDPAQRYDLILEFFLNMTIDTNSTPGPFAGKIEQTANYLSQLVGENDLSQENRSKIYECCKSLVTSMKDHVKVPIRKLLNICLPLYDDVQRDDQEWLERQVLDSYKEENLLPLEDIIPLALNSSSRNSFDSPCVQLAISTIKEVSKFELEDADISKTQEYLNQIAEKCFSSKFSQVESQVLLPWLNEDYPAFLDNVIKIIDKHAEMHNKHKPNSNVLKELKKQMDSGDISIENFQKTWRVYITWAKDHLSPLWDIVRSAFENNDRERLPFIVEQLEKDNCIQANAILADQSKQKNLTGRICNHLLRDINLIMPDNLMIQTLLNIVPSDITSNTPLLIEVIKIGLNGNHEQMKATMQIIEKCAGSSKAKLKEQILKLVGERGESVREEPDLFESMKKIAEDFAQELDVDLPGCFIVTSKEAEEVDHKGIE